MNANAWGRGRVQRAFLVLDFLFRFAWVLWLPTFFIYINIRLFENDASLANALIVWMYVFMCGLEVTLGAVADLMSGVTMFYVSCALNAASYLAYALLPFLLTPHDRFLGALACEFVGGVGMTLFSGAFERWYQGTMELAAPESRALKNFARLRMVRYIASALAGVVGIMLYGRFVGAGPTMSIAKVFLVPHFWGAVVIVCAAAAAWFLRRAVTRDDLLVAGGDRLGDRRGRLRWTAISKVQHAVRDGWSAVMAIGSLRGAIYLACANQLGLTVVSFYVPLLLWGGASDPLQQERGLIFYWLFRELARASGSGLSTFFAKRLRERESELAVGASVAAGVVFLIAAAACFTVHGSLSFYRPMASTRTFVVGACGIIIMFLYALAEPFQDAVVLNRAPPDLRSVAGSFKSMLSVGFSAAALIPLGMDAMWRATRGEMSFGHLFALTGAVVACVSVYAVRKFDGWSFGSGSVDLEASRDS